MSNTAITAWVEVVKLHPDVLAENFSEDVFALDLGPLADISPSAELSALGKLTANWKSVIEDKVFTAEEQADQKRGQRRLFE